MKISAFLTISNPIKRQDPFMECLENMLDFADEIVIINGDNNDFEKEFDNWDKVLLGFSQNYGTLYKCENGKIIKIINYPWPKEFDWTFIGKQFQRGYDACTGDFIFRFDADYFLHEDSFEYIREFLKENPDHPAYTMPKKQFLLVDKFRVKSLVPIAFNKGKYGNRIKLDSGGDLCQPSLDGKELKACYYGEKCPIDKMPIISRKDYVVIDDNIPEEEVKKRLPNLLKKDGRLYTQYRGIPFFNYECILRTKEIEAKEFHRFAKAWKKTFGNDPLGAESEKIALQKFLNMQLGRFKSGGWSNIKLGDHPKYIQETIKNLKPEQFGYSLWGNTKPAYYYK